MLRGRGNRIAHIFRERGLDISAPIWCIPSGALSTKRSGVGDKGSPAPRRSSDGKGKSPEIRRERSARRLGRKNWRKKGGGRDGAGQKVPSAGSRRGGEAAAGAGALGRFFFLNLRRGKSRRVRAEPCLSLKKPSEAA